MLATGVQRSLLGAAQPRLDRGKPGAKQESRPRAASKPAASAWRPQGESNPGSRREGAGKWTFPDRSGILRQGNIP